MDRRMEKNKYKIMILRAERRIDENKPENVVGTIFRVQRAHIPKIT